MDSLLPTGFILVVLPLAWLLVQALCWWGMSRFIPQHSHSEQITTDISIPAGTVPAHVLRHKSS